MTLNNNTIADAPPIIDLEASGFGSTSYPIEVGVVMAGDARYCQLIRPVPSWTHWDDSAEQLHGISRQTLFEHGREPKEIVANLNQLLGTSTVYTDAWVVDYPWLRTLSWAAQIDMTFRVSPLEGILSEAQMEIWQTTRAQVEAETKIPRHRASIDAQIIQATYEKTRLLVG
ncbi:MAG: hypothetical protein AAF387_08855 [Pseudomonadota bacterium]